MVHPEGNRVTMFAGQYAGCSWSGEDIQSNDYHNVRKQLKFYADKNNISKSIANYKRNVAGFCIEQEGTYHSEPKKIAALPYRGVVSQVPMAMPLTGPGYIFRTRPDGSGWDMYSDIEPEKVADYMQGVFNDIVAKDPYRYDDMWSMDKPWDNIIAMPTMPEVETGPR